MKRYFICILAAVALASCLREPVPESADDGLVEKTWTVSFDAGTRGTLDETLYPVWEVGEKLSVYDPVVQTGRVFTVNEVNVQARGSLGFRRDQPGQTACDADHSRRAGHLPGCAGSDGAQRASG